jgi:hypothetical protein
MRLDFFETDVILHTLTHPDVKLIFMQEAEECGHEKHEAEALYKTAIKSLKTHLCL